MYSIYVEHIPNCVTRGLLMQEDAIGHQQGGQPSLSGGIESERRKDERKRVDSKDSQLCSPSFTPSAPKRATHWCR